MNIENNGSNSELVSALLAALLGRQQPLPPNQVVAVPPTHQPHPVTPGSTSAARDEVNGGLQAGQEELSSLRGGGGRRGTAHPFSGGGVQSSPRRNRIGVSSSSSIENQAMSPLQKKSRISES